MSNPLSDFVGRNPWIAAGPHMRCVGTGLLALWRKNPDSALRIGASVMDASPSRSSDFWVTVSYIGRMLCGKTEAEDIFLCVLERYAEKPANDERLTSLEWSDLYNHRTAFSRFVEMACVFSDSGSTVDEWRK